MNPLRFISFPSLVSLAIAIVLAAPARPASSAEPAKGASAKWATNRATVPETLGDLKALQDAVQKVVVKTTPCTVGVVIGLGQGSGVIVSADGLVLTAGHVASEPGKDCTIILPSGKRVKAKTLGDNEALDSGMIRITEKGPKNGKWPFVPLGKSSDLKKGQWVVAMGHPGGWQRNRPPVARLGQVERAEKSKIRTTCTIVGGDSGGPLFDLDGKLIGIHSRIGYTLASNIHVPIDGFKADWDQLVKGEQVGKPGQPPFLGVHFGSETTPILDYLTEGGPASAGGLQVDDTIIKFDGKEVSVPDDIRAILRKKKPGDKVVVVAQRGAKTVTVTVKLAKRTE